MNVPMICVKENRTNVYLERKQRELCFFFMEFLLLFLEYHRDFIA